MIKKASLLVTIISVTLIVCFYSILPQVAHSQGETEVKCGQIIERDFTGDVQEHIYLLSVEPRWSFDVSVKPYGDDLKTIIALYGPTNKLIGLTNGGGGATAYYRTPSKAPAISSGILSSRGPYKIRVANTSIYIDDQLIDESRYFGGVGFYTLSIGCTTSEGAKIPANGNPLPTATSALLLTPTVHSTLPENPPTFTGTGFPGLPPVDFTNAITLPLPLGESVNNVIPLDGQMLAFTLDAAIGDTLDLSYTRLSGNMNLGLVVLSENNEVFFQASLVTSESLSTRFTLPEAGEYTIGIFRISLVEPAEAKPTLFQLQGTLNSTE